jgi:hypothetical protein
MYLRDWQFNVFARNLEIKMAYIDRPGVLGRGWPAAN